MSSKLPNAPLIEVVFELRWKLSGPEKAPPPMLSDPGYSVLLDGFSHSIRKAGFKHVQRMADEGMLLGYSIDRRFYRAEGRAFPLVQVGVNAGEKMHRLAGVKMHQ